MPFFKSNDLKIWTGGEWKQLPKDITINKFSTDTRTLEKGDAFVCLVGERDGHEFAKTAQELGASAIIASKELEGIEIPVLLVADTLKALQTIAKMHRLRLDYPVVGITGSCGKTFTKELLAKTLAWRSPCYSEKHLNNQLGVALSLLKADCKNNNLAIIEAGVSRPEEMDVLASMIEPDIAVITNVTASHVAGFGEIKQIAKEKAKLAEHCAEGGYCVMPAGLLSWKSFDELKCKKAIALPMDAIRDSLEEYTVTRYRWYSAAHPGLPIAVQTDISSRYVPDNTNIAAISALYSIAPESIRELRISANKDNAEKVAANIEARYNAGDIILSINPGMAFDLKIGISNLIGIPYYNNVLHIATSAETREITIPKLPILPSGRYILGLGIASSSEISNKQYIIVP